MKKRNVHKKEIAVFLLICQCMIVIIPGSRCLAESVQDTEVQADTEVNVEEQEVVAQELDLGDYETQMSVGAKQLLSVTVLPMDATNQIITYSSSNTQVASINGMGRITALSIGTTEITASCGTVSAGFTLTIVEAETEKVIEVTDIELADFEEELQVDKTMNLSATVLPTDATDTTVRFSSSNEQIATVTSTGEVKGISPGQVTITVQAGNFTKSIVLTVKAATTAINLNSTYVVLKCGETYHLSGQALPKEASQILTFKSVDIGIAAVSGDGTITANAVGNTTIIVSNGDMSNAVTVIVNETGEIQNEEPLENGQAEETGITTKEEELLKKLELAGEQETLEVKAEEYAVITPVVLKALYTSEKRLSIQGENYTIKLSGKDIVNYENKLYTELEQKEVPEGVEFILNQGKNLPGQVVVSFSEENGYKYVYLYNQATQKYEKIKQEVPTELKLSTAGTYMLSTTRLSGESIKIYVVIGISVIVLALGGIYIIIKKKYWFW